MFIFLKGEVGIKKYNLKRLQIAVFLEIISTKQIQELPQLVRKREWGEGGRKLGENTALRQTYACRTTFL